MKRIHVELFLIGMFVGVACAEMTAPEPTPYDMRVMVVERDTTVVFFARDFNDMAAGVSWSVDIIEAGWLQTDSLASTTVAVTYPLRIARPMTFCAWVINNGDTKACVKWPEGLESENE